MKVIGILEDDPFIAEELERVVSTMGHKVGINTSLPKELIDYVNKDAVDLLLLDVNLGQEMDGIETAKQILSNSYIPIVFITSYFDDITLSNIRMLNPRGYVLKPFREIDVKININLGLQPVPSTPMEYSNKEAQPIFIKKSGDLVKVNPETILFLKGEDNYTLVHFEDGTRHMSSSTLKLMSEQFTDYGFLRVHKSYAINLNKLETVSGSVVYVDGESIPIGKSYKKGLLASLHIV